MAEPLVIAFAADTSRAQGAMATLASQIVGNMATIGVAMSGGAANSNTFGASLQGLATNAQRAAAAAGQDVRAIASATANAATSDKATLESVVRAFTGAAASSNTAGAAVRTGLSATTGAVSGVAAQIPSLNTLLAAFLGFEAAKLVFDSVAASIEAARAHIAAFVRIGREAEKAGVGTGFFQRATLDAEKFGLTVEQVVAALQHARAASEVRIGEGKDGTNAAAIDARLTQNVRAGNLSAADKAGFDAADTQEAKIRAMLDLIDKLRADQRDLAAFDLAGHFFGPDFERQLRSGVDLTNQLRETLDSTSTTVAGVRIVGADEVERARQLDAKARDIADTFATALAPIQHDISNAVLDTYQAFLDVERVIARVVQIAVNLYETVTGMVGKVRELVGSIPGIGKMLTAGNPLTFLQEADYRDATENAQQALRQSAEAARFFAQAAADGLTEAIVNGKSFASVLADIAKQLERSMLSGLLTGTGPLAGLLGTAPLASAGPNASGRLLGNLFGGLAGGGAGRAGAGGALPGPPASGATRDLAGASPLGLLGTLFGGLFRANGGPVAAGQPVTVGEMGRELFVPQTGGTIVPIAPGAASGPQSVDNSRSYTIDARGAQAGVAEQITAALGAYDRGLSRTLAARSAVASRRYGTGR